MVSRIISNPLIPAWLNVCGFCWARSRCLFCQETTTQLSAVSTQGSAEFSEIIQLEASLFENWCRMQTMQGLKLWSSTSWRVTPNLVATFTQVLETFQGHPSILGTMHLSRKRILRRFGTLEHPRRKVMLPKPESLVWASMRCITSQIFQALSQAAS